MRVAKGKVLREAGRMRDLRGEKELDGAVGLALPFDCPRVAHTRDADGGEDLDEGNVVRVYLRVRTAQAGVVKVRFGGGHAAKDVVESDGGGVGESAEGGDVARGNIPNNFWYWMS